MKKNYFSTSIQTWGSRALFGCRFFCLLPRLCNSKQSGSPVKSTTMLRSKLPAFIWVFASSAALSAEPSGADSKTDWDKRRKIIVVAELKAGEYLTKPPECSKPNIICIDPPPFWFTARISSTVFGEAPPAEIRVTTNSHFGMKIYERMKAPQLVLLRSNGIEFVMPRYSREPLISDKSGKLYLRTFARQTISWLPCETGSLREEIFPVDFDEEGLDIKKDEFSNYDVTTNPSMYNITHKDAWPRYAIPVDRLRAYLAKAGPDVELACKAEQ
jgi:hypothetical protein